MTVNKNLFLIFAGVVILVGCRDRTQVTVAEIRPRETNSDHLQQALQVIDELDVADFNQATTTSIFNNNCIFTRSSISTSVSIGI